VILKKILLLSSIYSLLIKYYHFSWQRIGGRKKNVNKKELVIIQVV